MLLGSTFKDRVKLTQFISQLSNEFAQKCTEFRIHFYRHLKQNIPEPPGLQPWL